MQTVLLVEDNDANASLFEDMFAYDDIPAKLVTAATGEECVDLAIALQPVLILMDLRLPGIDGLETTQILKRDRRTKDIPVWAITAYAMPGDEERTLMAGCDEYFTKPTRMRTFGDSLKTFLNELHEALHEERIAEYEPTQSADR